MTDFSKFDETELPSKKAFYSYLYEEDITHEEYRRAQKILWKHFNIKNLGEYYDLNQWQMHIFWRMCLKTFVRCVLTILH